MLHVLLLSFHLFCSTITHAMSYGSWQTGGSMPLRNDMMAIGYDDTNDTIWLLGGSEASKQLLAFDIHTQTFIQNQTGLSHGFSGDHYFTQIGHILWMIGGFDAAQTFSIFNVITAQFSYDYNHIAIPVRTREPGCLASTIDDNHNSYLFAVGGKNASYKALYLTQIYNISSNSWLENVPSMQTNRASFSCIVQNNKLFSIGGWTSTAPYYLDSIEVLDVSTTNLYNNFMIKWQYIDSLNAPREHTNAVGYMDKVLVIGGGPSGNGGGSSDAIHVINTVSDTVTYYDESLVTGVYDSAPVVVDGTLFAFGGYTYGTGYPNTNNWQYTLLPTQTQNPTSHNPTSVPSSNPTQIPTFPSKEPTVIPTVTPTLLPTVQTMVPTIGPTLLPSSSPTILFTGYPTSAPILLLSTAAVVDATNRTTSTLSITIGDAGTANDWSFVDRMVGNIGVFITFVGTSICCTLVACFLFCRLRDKNTVKHAIQEQSDNNRPLPKQPTASLIPPGVRRTSISFPKYASEYADEGVPTIHIIGVNEEDSVRQESKSDSEDLYVIHPDANPTSKTIDYELKIWLAVNGFAHYLNNFVLHGYDSLDFVKYIQDVQDLIAIGIMREADQHKLMSLIRLRVCNHREDGETVELHILR
eukprot:615715_1